MCVATVTAVAVVASAAATIGSTAYKLSQGGSTTTDKSQQLTGVVPAGPAEIQFQQGTNQLLNEARGVVENATGQGQQVDPKIYQWLGMDPIYEDKSAQLQEFSGKVDAAQQSLNTMQNNINTLQGIPQGKRTPTQRKQLRQMMRQFPKLQKQVSDFSSQRGQLETMPKRITGFNRLDPNAIPKESPFSTQNPLNQAQSAEAARLNDYLSGKRDVDPTLKHQWDTQEAALRANLAGRIGPDYENSSVGQTALTNFNRARNESYATWNENMVDKYNAMAFGGAANLQSLLAGQIHLTYAPSEEAAQRGKNLQDTANARIRQESILQNERGIKSAKSGTETTSVPTSEVAGTGKTAVSGIGGIAQLIGDLKGSGTTPASGGAAGAPTDWSGGGSPSGGGLANWLGGIGGAGGADTSAVSAGT